MVEWKSPENGPDKVGDIVVQIGDKYFFGNAMKPSYSVFIGVDTIYYEIEEKIQCAGIPFFRGGNWNKPSHFGEIKRWAYLEVKE